MAKIRVEIEVPSGKYCDSDDTCSLLKKGCFGQYWCSLYGDELEIDKDNWLISVRNSDVVNGTIDIPEMIQIFTITTSK